MHLVWVVIEVVGRLVTGVGRLGTTLITSTRLRTRGKGGTTKAHTHGTSLRLRGILGRFEGMSLRRSGGWVISEQARI